MATSMTVSIATPMGQQGFGALLGAAGPTLTASFNFILDAEDEARDYGREAARYFTAFVEGYAEGLDEDA